MDHVSLISVIIGDLVMTVLVVFCGCLYFQGATIYRHLSCNECRQVSLLKIVTFLLHCTCKSSTIVNKVNI